MAKRSNLLLSVLQRLDLHEHIILTLREIKHFLGSFTRFCRLHWLLLERNTLLSKDFNSCSLS